MPQIYEFEKCPCCGGKFKEASDITKICQKCAAELSFSFGHQSLRKPIGHYFVVWSFNSNITSIVPGGIRFEYLLPFDLSFDQIKLYAVFS